MSPHKQDINIWKVEWKEIYNLNNLLGKLIVWPLYLYFPPHACFFWKIGLTQAMNISSIWESMDSIMGWSQGSILFHLENQWPLVFLWHWLQMCPLRYGWVRMPRYDSVMHDRQGINLFVEILGSMRMAMMLKSTRWKMH